MDTSNPAEQSKANIDSKVEENNKLYNIYVNGDLLEGFTIYDAKVNLAENLQIPEEKVLILLSGKKIYLKKGATKAQALSLVKKINRAGMKVYSEIDGNVKSRDKEKIIENGTAGKIDGKERSSLSINDVVRVEQYIPIESGICDLKSFYTIGLISLGVTITLTLLAFGIISLIHIDIIFLTVGMIMVGPWLGVSLSNNYNFSCRNSKKRMKSLIPSFAVIYIAGIVFIFAAFGTPGSFSFLDIFEAFFCFITPFFTKDMLKSEVNYCESCKRPMKKNSVDYPKVTSPVKILEQLRFGIVPKENNVVSQTEDEKYPGQTKIAVNSYQCPKCKDAIVTATLYYSPAIAAKTENFIFYSDFIANCKIEEV